MKIILLVLLVGVSISCTDVTDRYVKKMEMVGIPEILIPDETVQLNDIQIIAKAQANNGCWSNLYFEWKKTKEFEYSLKAYGTYESFGMCPEMLVTKDTVIDFKPTETGTYRFHISRKPHEVDVHTLVVE